MSKNEPKFGTEIWLILRFTCFLKQFPDEKIYPNTQ